MGARLAQLSIALAAVAVLAGCGNAANQASAPTPIADEGMMTPHGDRATLLLRPGLADALTVRGGGAAGPGALPGAVALPIDGGRVVVDTLRGRIALAGRLVLRHGGRSMTVDHVVVDSDAGTITGTVGGGEVTLLRFDAAQFRWAPPDSGTIDTADVPLTATPGLADLVTRRLGSDAVRAGTQAGRLNIRLAQGLRQAAPV
jgi:hypothetical protein